MKRNLILAAISCLLIINTYAQRSISEVEQILTASSEKEWIQDEVISIMYGDSCISGVSWVFREKNSQVIKKTCLRGTWHHETLNWSIKKSGDFNWKISINEKTLNLTIRQLEDYDKIILREDEGDVREETVLIHIK
ncbi:hypothetical protein KFE98_15090 [bacterium SCSIO 12741]|nr:hypothetical protein KFE98_15090 [bacterium SCSIO 12741]